MRPAVVFCQLGLAQLYLSLIVILLIKPGKMMKRLEKRGEFRCNKTEEDGQGIVWDY